MALQNVQRIQIELDGSAPFEYVVAKAGEKESRIVEVTLLENKKEFTIPALGQQPKSSITSRTANLY